MPWLRFDYPATYPYRFHARTQKLWAGSVIFDDIRDADSDCVKTALERRCAVCPSKPGELCVDVKGERTLFEAVGRYVHLMRADGLPYSPKRKTA